MVYCTQCLQYMQYIVSSLSKPEGGVILTIFEIDHTFYRVPPTRTPAQNKDRIVMFNNLGDKRSSSTRTMGPIGRTQITVTTSRTPQHTNTLFNRMHSYAYTTSLHNELQAPYAAAQS